MLSLLNYFLAVVMTGVAGGGKPSTPPDSAIAVAFDGGYGPIEVGGPYAGFESHHSRPLPSRLSFYAPVANSMDLSRDYQHRDESQILFLGLQIDGGPRRLIGWEPWPYVISPASVTFTKRIDHTDCKIAYSFCQNLPGMVAQLIFRNRDSQPHTYRLYTHWETSLRTCQSYKLKDYWKDDGFKTELAGKDNWNHFWLILVAASYLRHTGDVALLRQLQPLLVKSLTFTLSHIGEDGLLWAEYPD
jgi:hypothetical protein